MSTTESTAPAGLEAVAHDGPRISASSEVYGEILDFLHDEAALLDDDRHLDWLELLDDAVTYRMPARRTVYRSEGHGFDDGSGHFDDDRLSLGLRVRRSVEITYAYDRDPAPRMRRFVSNLVLHQGVSDDEYEATTNFQIVRNRFAHDDADILTAKREDVIRRTDDGLKLLSRLILVDRTALDSTWISVFM